jgi:hypothetical protein
MLDHDTAFAGAEAHAAPSFRDRLPTLPCDLSEYARVATGPTSWSAHRDAEALSAWALEAHDDPINAVMTELLVDLSPTDIPRVAMTLEQVACVVTHREAFVVASIDGQSTLEMLIAGMDRARSGEVLGALCNLCARGIVVFDRSTSTST